MLSTIAGVGSCIMQQIKISFRLNFYFFNNASGIDILDFYFKYLMLQA